MPGDGFGARPGVNESWILTVYLNAEALCSKLTKLKRRFKDWVVLGTVDLEQALAPAYVKA